MERDADPPLQVSEARLSEASYGDQAAPLAGRVAVKLGGAVAAQLRAHLAKGGDVGSFGGSRDLAGLARRHQVSAARQAFGDESWDDSLRARIRVLVAEGRPLDADIELPHLQDVFLFTFDGEAPANHVALDCEQSPDVIYAEALSPVTATSIPVDALYPQQWGPRLMMAEPAWDLATGLGQTIAVVDSGMAGGHVDLQAKIDPASYDAVTGQIAYPPVDPIGHGTHVAGIAAAEHSTVGVAGMAPDAGLLSVSVLDMNQQFDPGALPGGITYAAAHAGIVNTSLAAHATSRLIEDAVQAAHAMDALLVASSGNDTSLYMVAPANVEWAMVVGAVDDTDQLASYSNTGTKVDVVAPGGELREPAVDWHPLVLDAEHVADHARHLDGEPPRGGPGRARPRAGADLERRAGALGDPADGQ